MHSPAFAGDAGQARTRRTQSALTVRPLTIQLGNSAAIGGAYPQPRSGHDFTELPIHGWLQRAPAEPGEMEGAGPGVQLAQRPRQRTRRRRTPPPPNPCTRDILAEGSCEYLVGHSRFLCCDPDNGIRRPGKTTSSQEPGKECPSEMWTPIFTCDTNCETALEKGCDDDDNWMAIPSSQFTRSRCGDEYTICANGRHTTGYVRDRSVTATSYEVSPGIQTTLGVRVGSTFKGAIYRPGASEAAIANDPCCSPPSGPREVPETEEEAGLEGA
jgi:hypothetical protein